MKKLIIVLLVIASFTSCKKNQDCWKCQIGAANGQPPRVEVVCGKYPDNIIDANGNQLPFSCTKN